MGYYVPNRAMPICYNCPYRTNKYCGLLTEHDYLGDYPLNYEPYPYCPLTNRPHGEWIVDEEQGTSTCSNCEVVWQFTDGTSGSNFCPNCGADMRGDNK